MPSQLPASKKLYKVLNWLVLEDDKKDEALQLMHANPSRIDKFVDFVFAHKNLCEVKKNGDVTCAKLRKKIDDNRIQAGTDGIDFNSRMTGASAMMARALRLKKSDTLKPYGPGVLLDWILELDGGKSIALIDMKQSQMPDNIIPAVKFIIHNKDKIWSIINKINADRIDEDDDGDTRPLAAFMAENASKLGIKENNQMAWNRLLLTLRARTNLLETHPGSILSPKSLFADLKRRNE